MSAKCAPKFQRHCQIMLEMLDERVYILIWLEYLPLCFFIKLYNRKFTIHFFIRLLDVVIPKSSNG